MGKILNGFIYFFHRDIQSQKILEELKKHESKLLLSILKAFFFFMNSSQLFIYFQSPYMIVKKTALLLSICYSIAIKNSI